MRRLDLGRVPGAREVDIPAEPLVVVVEAGNIGPDAVHRRHLKRRRGGRHPDAHRMEAVLPVREEPPDVRHVSRGERAIEDDARESVDLHDDQSPPNTLRAAAATESSDQSIDDALQLQNQTVQGCSLRGR